MGEGERGRAVDKRVQGLPAPPEPFDGEIITGQRKDPEDSESEPAEEHIDALGLRDDAPEFTLALQIDEYVQQRTAEGDQPEIPTPPAHRPKEG